MPNHGEAPSPAETTAPPDESIFFEDGTLNEDVLGQQFGLGAAEAMQEVTFGSYTGTAAEMLADPKCPVGGMIKKAYAEEGIDGVERKFASLQDMDPEFKFTITPETLEREGSKKK
jgi:hypothetical protein